jgi:hypothetical protein
MTGPCLICGTTPRRLHADHCHKHDQQRGMICPRCNRLMSTIDADRKPPVPAAELQALTEYATRCPDCAAGKPATADVYPIHLRLSDDLDKALRAYAAARGLGLATAVRLILHERLTTGDGAITAVATIQEAASITGAGFLTAAASHEHEDGDQPSRYA